MPMFLDIILRNGLAPGTVTTLTVDQRHFGTFNLQLSVSAFLQDSSVPIVRVASCKAGLVTDIIGEEGPYEHLFVFPHGNNGTAGF